MSSCRIWASVFVLSKYEPPNNISKEKCTSKTTKSHINFGMHTSMF